MTAQTEITKVMNRLKFKAIRKGMWENFGDKEARKLKDKFGDIGMVRDFENWCLNMDDRGLQMSKEDYDKKVAEKLKIKKLLGRY